ncbi:MAG: hypothetical protein H0T42_30715 [Deltaproteobacteria bacterium]|nr:hypothetical protein [Deltaproteobacteria bacterium]
MASVRPADEFDMTVKVSKDATEIAGLGEKALVSDKTGLYVKVAGKPYFFHFMSAGASGIDNDKAVALAKAVVPGAK